MSIPSAIPSILIVVLVAAIQAALGEISPIQEPWAYIAVVVLSGLLRWLQVSVTPPAGFARIEARSLMRRWLWGD